MWAKIARDGMKTVLGMVYPLLLVYMISVYKSEPKAWAVVAVIFAIPPIILYIINGIWIKNSQLERDNVIQATVSKSAPKQQKGNILDTFRGIFANRHMLCAFIAFSLTKLYYFSFLTGGSYTFRYYFGNFGLFAFFSTGCTLLAIIGAFASPFLRKVFKDVKYTFAGSIAIQAVFMIVALFVYNASRPWPSMIIIFCTFFFNGVSDTMSMPLFVGASDYANAKYKTNDVGLTMAIWGLAMNVGTLSNTWIRTWVLNTGGFDAKALAKAGAVVPAALKQTLWLYNTVIPLCCMVVATLLIFFGYGLKDADIERYRLENAQRLGTK
jgi:Na+/melibiose symporter-like transporter